MNIEKSNDNDGRWEENYQEEFEAELRRIKKAMNDNGGDEMNIDRAK